MEDNHIKHLNVSGFKKFTELEVGNIGQFNLIIGDNNVGKTSLLEALLADDNYEKFFNGIGSINYSLRNFKSLTNHFINLYVNNLTSNYPKSFVINFEAHNKSKHTTKVNFKNSSDRKSVV